MQWDLSHKSTHVYFALYVNIAITPHSLFEQFINCLHSSCPWCSVLYKCVHGKAIVDLAANQHSTDHYRMGTVQLYITGQSSLSIMKLIIDSDTLQGLWQIYRSQ